MNTDSKEEIEKGFMARANRVSKLIFYGVSAAVLLFGLSILWQQWRHPQTIESPDEQVLGVESPGPKSASQQAANNPPGTVLLSSNVEQQMPIQTQTGYLAKQLRGIEVEFDKSLETIQLSGLSGAIDEYNRRQLAACGDLRSINTCPGASRLAVAEMPESFPYLVLTKTTVRVAHSYEVDAGGTKLDLGVDTFDSYVFRKESDQIHLLTDDGKIIPTRSASWVLSVSFEESCAGSLPSGSIKVWHLPDAQEAFVGDLAHESHRITKFEVHSEPSIDAVAVIDVEVEQQIEAGEQCKSGIDVNHIKKQVGVYCDDTGGRCELKQLRYEESPQCVRPSPCR